MRDQLVFYLDVDVAFLVNWAIDLAWLCATAALAGVQTESWRLPLSAAVGAAGAVWAYFPTGSWLLSVPGLVAGTILMLLLAFWPLSWQRLSRVAGYFMLTGGVMAGTAMLADQAGGGRFGLAGIEPVLFRSSLIAIGLLCGLMGSRYLWRVARERVHLKRGIFQFRMRIGADWVEVPALMDTGNSLREPFSGLPVVMVEASALRQILPEAVVAAASQGWDGWEHLPRDWVARCRLVPYQALGVRSGVILALIADELAIQPPGSADWSPMEMMVGLTGLPLHREGLYRALLPHQIVGEGTGIA